MTNNQNSASLILSVGSRVLPSAVHALNAYQTRLTTLSGTYVIGSSLEFSREEQPGGKVVAKPLEEIELDKFQTSQVKGLFDVDQIVIEDLQEILHDHWRAFREHAARVKVDPSRKGQAHNQIIILGDAWDTDCTYLLLPTLYILKSFAEEEADTQIDVLLDISNFNEFDTTPNQEALVYRLIKEIENRIDPNPAFTNDYLLKKLGYDMDLKFNNVDFYLISEKKEGGLFAKNHKEIEEITLSFLLGILNPNVRDVFYSAKSEETRRLDRSYFSSFGSVGIAVPTKEIIEYCKLRLSHYILDHGLLEDNLLNSELIRENSNKIISNLGDSLALIKSMILEPAFSLDSNDVEDWRLKFSDLDINYQPPLIDQMHLCSFLKDAEEAYQIIIDQTLLGEFDVLKSNIDVTLRNVIKKRQGVFWGLLLNPELYPNYFLNLKHILKNTLIQLQALKTNSLGHQKRLPSETDVLDNLAKAKERYQDLLKRFPDPPIWFRRIPESGLKDFLRKIISLPNLCLYNKLDKARLEVEKAYERKICSPYERVLSDFNVNLAHQSIVVFAELEQMIADRQRTLEGIAKDLLELRDKAQRKLFSSNEDEVFLYKPLNQEILDELYNEFSPSVSLIGSKLISELHLLHNLVTVGTEDLKTNLDEFSKRYFNEIDKYPLTFYINQHASSLTLNNHIIPKKYKDFTNKIRTMITYQSEVTGNYFPAPTKAALLSAEGEDFWKVFFENQDQEWESFYSSSPYFASFSQVQHLMTYAGLEVLFEKGQRQWDALSDSEKEYYDIVPNPEKRPASAIAERINDDTWRISYEWAFEPSDKKTPHTFKMSIDVNPREYYKLLSRDRYRGQYHLYAEEDSHEVDQIVVYLKHYNKLYKLSPYDQAQNVLTFVQSFIAYRSDLETTTFNDYPRYPLETLWDRVGDCEDVAILAGAILSRLGHKVALLDYPRHLAFGVQAPVGDSKYQLIKDEEYGISYYYGEATAKGWKIGDIPENYRSMTPTLHRIFENTWK